MLKCHSRLLVQIENLMVETSMGVTDIQESVYAFWESYKDAGLGKYRQRTHTGR